MTPNQESLIQEFVKECKTDGIPREEMALQLIGFLRSLGNQERSTELRDLAGNLTQVNELVDRFWA